MAPLEIRRVVEAGSDAVETSGLKESCGEDGVWNHLTWSEYLKIAQGRLLVKGQPSRNTDTRILEMSGPWDE